MERQAREIKALKARVAEMEADRRAALAPPELSASDDELETESTAESTDADDPDFTLDDSKGVKSDGVERVMTDAATFKGTTRLLTGLPKSVLAVAFDIYVPYIMCTNNLGQHTDDELDWRAWRITPQQQMFITLVWLRLYHPIWFLAIFFSLPARYLPKILKRVTGAMHFAIASRSLSAEQGGCFFPRPLADLRLLQERFQLYGLEQSIDIALDGMHLLVWARNTRKRRGETRAERADRDTRVRKLRQPKHACYGTMALVACTLDGLAVWYTAPAVGKEQQLLKESDLRELCRDQGTCVVADAGLKLNRKSEPHNMWCNTKQSAGPKLIRLSSLVVKNPLYFTADQVKFFTQVLFTATAFSRLRIIIENFICALRVFQILCQPYRGPFGDMDCSWYQVHQTVVFDICIALRNLLYSNWKPLRAADWVPNGDDIPQGFVPGYPGVPHANIDAVQRLAALQFGVEKGGLERARRLAAAQMKEQAAAPRSKKAQKLPEPDYGTDSSKNDSDDDEMDDAANFDTVVHDERNDAHFFFGKDRPQPLSKGLDRRKASKAAAADELETRRQRLALQAAAQAGAKLKKRPKKSLSASVESHSEVLVVAKKKKRTRRRKRGASELHSATPS